MILGFFKTLRRGRFLEEVGEKLDRLMRMVRANKAPGVLTIKFKVEPKELPEHEGEFCTVSVVESIVLREPQPARSETQFFVDNFGTFGTRDPRQRAMEELRKVEHGTELKSVDNQSAAAGEREE